MKYLYKYPQATFPYADLVATNGRRSREEMEYELLDTGVFNDDRYFDIFVEYAKGDAEDILVKITAINRGPEQAELHLLPTLWFRNDWSAWIAESNRAPSKPCIKQNKAPKGLSVVTATHPLLGEFALSCEGDVPLLFTENETNHERRFGQPNESSHVKDGINDCIVQGMGGAVNSDMQGTKVAAHYRTMVSAGQTHVVRLRFASSSPARKGKPFERLRRMPELMQSIHPTGPEHLGVAERGIIALVNPERLRRILTKMLDENEFLCPHGIRSLSKFHEQKPFIFHVQGHQYRVDYLPGESNTGMFGGNSNWRGPVWMPVNIMVIRSLLNFYLYYGDTFTIECPTGSGKMMNLFAVAKEIADRLGGIFLQDESGRRPVYGGTEKFQTDPHWRDLILFYEYFHGDNGAGLGASHQTGWTGLVAKTIQLFGLLDAEKALAGGKKEAFAKG